MKLCIRYSRLFEYIIKKHQRMTDHVSINIRRCVWIYVNINICKYMWIYVNKIENRIILGIKTEYCLKIFRPETIKLLENAKRKWDCENGEYVLHLEITEVALAHCKIVDNDYHHNSRDSYTFSANKSFSELLGIFKKVYSKVFHIEL